ncbi:hypothetical protein [Agrobacterium radiobacter]|uniref:hypothetical protein n=1 Tax=Agrobacterium radiobacter TaxID=362 RepID=UPI003CE509C1
MMEFVELSWTDQGGGRYSLAVEYPDGFEQHRRDEIDRVIHDAGFSSQGGGRWLTSQDPNAPAAMWEQLQTLGAPLEMDTAVLPPSLMLVIADLHFV